MTFDIYDGMKKANVCMFPITCQQQAIENDKDDDDDDDE